MLEDREVIRRCHCGQTDLIDILIDRYQVALYSFCLRLTRDRHDADDLFQETWVRFLRHIDRCSEHHKVVTWLYTICLNHYRDRYRKQKRWLKRLVSFAAAGGAEQQAPAPEPAPEQQAISSETAAAVNAAVQQLPDSHRLPILLRYYQDLPVDEIAQALGVPAGTVKSRLYAGRKKLQSILEGTAHG